MSMGLILKILLAAEGVGIIFRILQALAMRRMIEVYSVSWVFFAAFLILAGVSMHPVSLEKYISWPFFILILIFFIIAIEGMFRITEHLSELMRKSSELEMQVSLLNEENYRLRKRLLRGQKENEEKTAVCDQHDGAGRSGADTSDTAEAD